MSKKIHVTTDDKIINETGMTDGFECFAPSNDIKKQQKKKFEENVSKLVALMENLTVKSLQLPSVNFILVNLNQ